MRRQLLREREDVRGVRPWQLYHRGRQQRAVPCRQLHSERGADGVHRVSARLFKRGWAVELHRVPGGQLQSIRWRVCLHALPGLQQLFQTLYPTVTQLCHHLQLLGA